MFVGAFVDVLAELMEIEGSMVCSLLNLDEPRGDRVDEAACIFFAGTMIGDKYVSSLRGDDSSTGWRYLRDRYACASDLAKWCIYCEKSNDVAVVAFENRTDERLPR